ncbi:transmembrane emp24 domain-containing protein 5 [Plakobranchus ocellatus]|uniref:Transmembrane emp24 domain-containing protein 5 n=1 Tax=Plakobranchus ocellatus TaxID=259542 RepID=A0AAV3ZZQ0_9GAST|nr:transmembrane emp24 domain-containing protein 5 [Plakobranchus ocellatus]
MSTYPYSKRLVLMFCFCSVALCSEIDLTIDIPAGRQECFWQDVPASTSVEVDYQVIDGGDLDISVLVSSPNNGRILHIEQKKTENVIRFNSEMAGDYKICFDNTFSTFSNKVVYFEIFVEDGKDDDDDDDEEHKLAIKTDYKSMERQLDMTVEQFLGILDRSKKNLERSVQVQTLIRIHEAKDRNTQEANFYRVNFFSCFQLVVMVVVSLCQVFMIRSLFQDRRTVSGSSFKART